MKKINKININKYYLVDILTIIYIIICVGFFNLNIWVLTIFLLKDYKFNVY